MIFIILNCIISCSLVFLIYYVDRRLQKQTSDANVILPPLLVATIEAVLFSIILMVNNVWVDGVLQWMIKALFAIDGIFWVVFSFTLLSLGLKHNHTFIKVIKAVLMAFVIFIVFFKFKSVEINQDYLLIVGSESIFSSGIRQYFSLNWASLYTIVYQYILPAVCYLFLMLLHEKQGTPVQLHQGLKFGEGLLLMWGISTYKTFMTNINPGYSTLFLVGYVFLYVFMIEGISRNSIPSIKSRIVTIFRVIVSYIIPAVAVAAFVMYFQPIGEGANHLNFSFCFEFFIISVVAIFISAKLSHLIKVSTKLYTADYAMALEKALGTIDYSQSMESITEKMYKIFRSNVQTSSLNVYIANGQGSLITAYSSNKKDGTISLANPLFDALLNINKSVVCYSEVGHVHDISVVEGHLELFFKETNSDAFFILNEGRNVLGLITLGKRINGDHYKDYDLDVFNKLYSYFFVFGYYMRNIANAEVLSVVSREIKMSSQIITSIQENLDLAKSNKIDVGYMMVPAHNIGGEFIDMIRLTDTRHLYVVGDLSGKGIAASMNMVILKSIIRTFLAETHDFKQLVVKVNTFIRDSLQKGTIFAGLFALIDFDTDTMYYINCGVPTLMLYTQVYNNVIEIQGSGHMLGFVSDIAPYLSVKTTKLSKGDIIVTCTDGLVHSHSLRGEQFGKERIQQALLDNSTYPAQRMAQFTFDGLTKFMSKELEDDISILILKYESAIEYAEEQEKDENSTEPATLEEQINQTTTDVIEPLGLEEIPDDEFTNEEVIEDIPQQVVQDFDNVRAVSDEEIDHEQLIQESKELTEETEQILEDANIFEETDNFADMFKN